MAWENPTKDKTTKERVVIDKRKGFGWAWRIEVKQNYGCSLYRTGGNCDLGGSHWCHNGYPFNRFAWTEKRADRGAKRWFKNREEAIQYKNYLAEKERVRKSRTKIVEIYR